MANDQTNEFNVDTDHAVAKIDKLTEAFARLNAELAKLSDLNHGGMTLEIIGEIVLLTVKPAKSEAS